MYLQFMFLHKAGAYLLAREQITQQWIGAFCWSGEQIFRLLQGWSVSANQTMGVAVLLRKPENAVLPKTHIRQPIEIKGLIAARIGQQFEYITHHDQMRLDELLSALPSIPSAHIIGWFVDTTEKSQETAIVFYTDPNGISNMAIVRNQLQSLTVLSYTWMDENLRTACQTSLRRLPVMGDDDLEIPILIQGEIVTLLIASALLNSATPIETS